MSNITKINRNYAVNPLASSKIESLLQWILEKKIKLIVKISILLNIELFKISNSKKDYKKYQNNILIDIK